jgi:protein-S-isoprenylcysteine O-methyltransferase Ste14
MTSHGGSSSFIERGGLWVAVQFTMMTAVIVLAILFHGSWEEFGVFVGGAVFLATGAVFGIAGVAALGRNRTPYPKPREQSELVQRGIYAYVRHPLYTSVMLVSMGCAMIWQSGPAVVAALALIPFLNAKARHEERRLRQKYPGYADYQMRVPRFLPRLRRTRVNPVLTI